jgi:hypothetical protein
MCVCVCELHAPFCWTNVRRLYAFPSRAVGRCWEHDVRCERLAAGSNDGTDAMQYDAMQCNMMQCNAIRCNAMLCYAMLCNAMQAGKLGATSAKCTRICIQVLIALLCGCFRLLIFAQLWV